MFKIVQLCIVSMFWIQQCWMSDDEMAMKFSMFNLQFPNHFFLFLVLLFARSLNHVSAIFGSKRCTRFTRYFHRKIGEIEMSILKVSSSFSMQMSSAIWIYASPTMENVFGRRPCSDVGFFNVNTRVSTTGKNECLMSTFKTLWIEFFRIQMFPVYFQLKLNSIMLLKLSTLTILKMN